MAKAEHTQEDVARERCGQVFEGVTADEMRYGENRGIESFEELGEDVENRNPNEIGRACVAGRKEEQEKREREKGGELDTCIKTEVAVPMNLAEIPLNGACCAEDE